MTRVRRLAVIAFLILGAARRVAAQSAAPLAQVPLEQLLRVEVQNVFGASERLQPVTEAPSSVTIVTADDIARFGYRNLGEILRSVRGFYVTDDRNYSYLGARGFARAGDYNTRILLLLNGHRINDNIYDQAPIGDELGIDPDVFERVEVIRGPASSLYGTNAFFAVVNIVTKSGRALKRSVVDVAGGSLGTAVVRGSTGRELSNGVRLGVAGSVSRSDGVGRLYFPAFDSPATNAGVADGLDGERVGSAYGTVEFRTLTITGVYGRRTKDVPTASYGTVFNRHDPRERTLDERALVGAAFAQTFGRTRVDVRSSFNRYAYHGVYPFAGATDDGPLIVNLDDAVGARWSLDARATHPVRGSQTVTVGAEFLDNIRQNQTSTYNDPSVEGVFAERASTQGALYVQDEVKLRSWLIVNGGARLDEYNAFSRVTPRGAIILLPSANESIKYLYGRAFRAPNAYELYYYARQKTLPALTPETIDTHEIDWERYFGSTLRTSVSAYAYRASSLIAFTHISNELSDYAFINRAINRARGVEFEGEVRSRTGLQMAGSYTLQRAVDEQDLTLTNSPRNLAKIRVSAPGPTSGSTASLEFQYVGRRETLAGTTVSGASLVNVNVRHRLSRQLELTALMANALNQHYADPASDEHAFDAIEQNGRTVRVGGRWTPWAR